MRYDFYIAGPMTGYPDWNFPAFNEAERVLTDLGYNVKNPAVHGDSGSWEDCMRLALTDMLQCNGIILLPGWEYSRGAVEEFKLARVLSMQVVHYHNFLTEKESINV